MVAMAWDASLSSAELALDGRTATRPGIDGDRAAALVPVPRHGTEQLHGGDDSFTLAVVVERLPKSGYPLYFGAGRHMPRDGAQFGVHDGTCGLRQHGMIEGSRLALSKECGARTDRDDEALAEHVPRIAEGARLALQLSPVGSDNCRTLRFFVNGVEAAAFSWIEDDGLPDPWVAGVVPSEGCAVRIVDPDGPEIWTEEGGAAYFTAFTRRLDADNAMRLSVGLGDDLNSRLFNADAMTGDVERHVAEKAETVDLKHKAAEQLAQLAAAEFRASDNSKPVKLRTELNGNFGVDDWPTCGLLWKQCREESGAREYNQRQTMQNDGVQFYPEAQIDDLVAVRTYTRSKPHAVNEALDDAVGKMKEPDELLADHSAMYRHLRTAVTALPGAAEAEALYRGVAGKGELSLRQYESAVGGVVNWKGFCWASISREKVAEAARGGMLVVIEPPHAWPSLGARVIKAPRGSHGGSGCQNSMSGLSVVQDVEEDDVDEVLLPSGLAFRVLSVTTEEDVSVTMEGGDSEAGARDGDEGGAGAGAGAGGGMMNVVRLKHLGDWVKEEFYKNEEVRMADAVGELREAQAAQKEHFHKLTGLQQKIGASQTMTTERTQRMKERQSLSGKLELRAQAEAEAAAKVEQGANERKMRMLKDREMAEAARVAVEEAARVADEEAEAAAAVAEVAVDNLVGLAEMDPDGDDPDADAFFQEEPSPQAELDGVSNEF